MPERDASGRFVPRETINPPPNIARALVIAAALVGCFAGLFAGFMIWHRPQPPEPQYAVFKKGDYVPDMIAEGVNLKLTFEADFLGVNDGHGWQLTPLFEPSCQMPSWNNAPPDVVTLIMGIRAERANPELPASVNLHFGQTPVCAALYRSSPKPGLIIRGD